MTRGASEPSGAPRVVAGLMSGTSADGIDAVVIEIRDGPARAPAERAPPGPASRAVPAALATAANPAGPAVVSAPVSSVPVPSAAGSRPERPAARIPGDRRVRLLAHHHEDFERTFRARILALADPRGCPLVEVARLHVDLGHRFARATLSAIRLAGLSPDRVLAVGSPGLTAAHVPGTNAAGHGQGTLCLGDGDLIAACTGLPVVSDMRAADRALGGQGAPLVPWADAVLLRPLALARGAPVAALNLGGIANLTVIPLAGDPVAFDTGPGNMLLDAWVERQTDGREQLDRGGVRALAGRIHPELLRRFLAEDDFVAAPAPKSTGRERYGEAFFERHAASLASLGLDDALATLAAFTVQAVTTNLRSLPPPGPVELVISGGGARNKALMAGLVNQLAPIGVQDSRQALGLDPQAREAVAFALMADASLRGEPSNVPSVTGARGLAVLGKLSPPSQLLPAR